ncbi:hypothetical protein CHS0354_016829 [Potamilus streckersoni]|uniref:Uncharacterized protein n=1 Tax=Potamilus streckersoni TaxID=2493646 RepID=A0AAE0W1L5_9BIVA|nr:hypothetical protein CHS0354_016829 [Potamilus streckersoni]
MRCKSKMSQSWRLLLFVTISKISNASRCPGEQVEHVIVETYERRCCYPHMVDIGNEFEMCSVDGGNDTQRPCGPGLIQPDQTSSEHEPECISEMEFLNCNSYDTKIVQDGASKKCICNLDAGFCGLNPLLCTQISSINHAAGCKVDQSCKCVIPNSLQPITQDRTEVTKLSNRVVNISLSQLPTKEKPSWTDGKTTEEQQSRGEHDVNNSVNNDILSNSNNNLSVVIPSVLVPCLFLGLLGLLLYSICQWRRSNIRPSAVNSPLLKGERNDIEVGFRDEEIGALRCQDSKVPVQSSSTSSINNTYEDLRTFKREAFKQARERSTTPACPASDISARAQDPGNLTSVDLVEELLRPVFHSDVPYTPLCPESIESSGMDRVYGEISRVPQSSESSVTQQTGVSSELVQSTEISLTQERREVNPVGAATAMRASDFGHDTNVKEYGRSPGPIQELTKGKNTTSHGAGEVRAERPVNVPCLEGSTERDSEDTELKAQECSQRTGVMMDVTNMPFTNELMARNTLILDLSSVVSDPSGVCSEDTEERNEETNCQDPFPSNSF